MRIFVDMDGTLAKWNNVEFEQLFEKGYYRSLEPNQKILYDVKRLIAEGKDVYILSAYLTESDYALKEKQEWLKEHLPELSEDKWLFVAYGDSKAAYFERNGLMPITQTDFLIDDYTKNLLEWKEYGGTGIKYLNGINHTHKTWQGAMIDYTDIATNERTLSFIVDTINNNSSKWYIEVVQEFDGTYYANMNIGGEWVKGLPEYVDYNTLKEAIQQKTGIVILNRSDMKFQQQGKKKYAYIDATQERQDCRVTLDELRNGYKIGAGIVNYYAVLKEEAKAVDEAIERRYEDEQNYDRWFNEPDICDD